MSTERWIWISGWGVPTVWLRERAEQAIPAGAHTVVTPAADVFSSIDWSRFDRAGGYSLGAFLLLQQAAAVPLPALLLAPFFAYPAEGALGGKIRQAQLRFLLRWLRNDPLAALADFYQRAGLDLPAPNQLPYPTDDLNWGLMQLMNEEAPARLPDGWSGFVGDQDPLLDAAALRAVEPRLAIVAGAGHDPAALLAAAVTS